MTCWNTRRLVTDYLDGRLRSKEKARVEAHLRDCDRCHFQAEQLRSVRSSLKRLKSPASPGSLRSSLLVLASRERQVFLETEGSRLRRVWKRWKFRFDQMMRPFTIPATGGVFSSVLLFAALAFTIGTTTRQVAYEVPVLYANRTDANLVPLELRSSVVLMLSLDARGRIRDYSVLGDSGGFVGDPTRLQSNSISMPEFPSVLAMAQPTIGDVRISFTPMVYRP